MNANRKKIVIEVFAFTLILLIAILSFYFITYDHPICIGDHKLCEQYEGVILEYSHTLMADFIGIPTHAQLIEVRGTEGAIVIYLDSIIPPSHTKVWHTDCDAPYWEKGFR